MPETLTKKQQTHQRMLDAASRSFKAHGFAGIGVDGIAKAAGVTSGAFYAHLGSKDEAFKAILIKGLDEVIEAVPAFQRDFGRGWVKAFAEYYLGLPHRADLACGCAMAALATEVVRSNDDIQMIFQEKMTDIANLVTKGLAGGSTSDRQARAWAMLSTLIGGLNVVRAIESNDLANHIAASITAATITIAGKTR